MALEFTSNTSALTSRFGASAKSAQILPTSNKSRKNSDQIVRHLVDPWPSNTARRKRRVEAGAKSAINGTLALAPIPGMGSASKALRHTSSATNHILIAPPKSDVARSAAAKPRRRFSRPGIGSESHASRYATAESIETLGGGLK